MKHEIVLSESEETVLSTELLDIDGWIENAIKEKARRATDRIIEKSGRGSRYTAPSDKEKIISDLKQENSELLKTAEEKIIEEGSK